MEKGEHFLPSFLLYRYRAILMTILFHPVSLRCVLCMLLEFSFFLCGRVELLPNNFRVPSSILNSNYCLCGLYGVFSDVCVGLLDVLQFPPTFSRGGLYDRDRPESQTRRNHRCPLQVTMHTRGAIQTIHCFIINTCDNEVTSIASVCICFECFVDFITIFI